MPLTPEELASLQATAYGSGGGDPGAPTSMPAAPIPTSPVIPPSAFQGGATSAGGDSGQPSSAPPPLAPPPVPGSVENPLPVQAVNPLAGSVGFSGDKKDAPPPIDPSLLTPPTPQVTTTSGSTVQKGIKLSPETQALRAQGIAGMNQGQALEENSLAGSQAAQHAANQKIAGMNQDAAAQAMSDQAKTDAALAPQRDAIKRATDELANRKHQTYWQTKSTGQKIGLALAQGLGAFAANYKIGGGHNAAADIIKAATDDYQHTEDAKDEQARQGLNAKVAAYGLDAAAFKDADQKKQAIRVMQLNAAAAQVQDEAAKSNDPLERAKMMQIHAQVSQAAAQASAHLDEMTANKVTTHSSSTPTSGGAPGGGLPSDRVVPGPDGKMYLAPSPEAAKKLREDSAVATRLNANIAKVQALRGAGQMPGTDAHAQMGPVLADIKRDWLALNSEKLKASGGGKELVEQAVGDPDSMFDWHGGARLDALASGVKADMATNYQTAGVVPLGPNHIAIVNGKPVLIDPSIPTYGKGK